MDAIGDDVNDHMEADDVEDEEYQEVIKAGGGRYTPQESGEDASTPPLLTEYVIHRDGRLSGLVFNKPGTPNGTTVTTSTVTSGEISVGSLVQTAAGSSYILGEMAATRRTGRSHGDARSTGKSAPSLFRADDSGELSRLLASHGLAFACGGTETGGREASKLLQCSFASGVDASVLGLSGHYRGAERLVLRQEASGQAVAAAVVKVHAEHSVIEVPIFATAKASRRRGYGSVLATLLVALARRLGVGVLVASATDESRAFWVSQGFHASSFCSQAVKSATRLLDQAGLLRGFANSTLLARGVGAEGECFEALESALDRCDADRVSGLNARRAAAALGFTDVHSSGSFWVDPTSGAHTALTLAPHEKLPAAFEWVPYSALEAFYVGADTGWGLRCSRAIADGQFVCEVLGHCMGEEEHSRLADQSCKQARPEGDSRSREPPRLPFNISSSPPHRLRLDPFPLRLHRCRRLPG
jgi:GNAT superfamily N-acetyltransferase